MGAIRRFAAVLASILCFCGVVAHAEEASAPATSSDAPIQAAWIPTTDSRSLAAEAADADDGDDGDDCD